MICINIQVEVGNQFAVQDEDAFQASIIRKLNFL